jgi:hypothetical protein
MKMGIREVKCYCSKCNNFFEDEEIFSYNGISELSEDDDNVYCPLCHTKIVEIDEGMVEVVKIMNDSKMVKTIFCCEGHITSDDDGYVDEISHPYICFSLTEYSTFNDIFDIGYLPTDQLCHKEVIKNGFEYKIGEDIGPRIYIRFSMRDDTDFSETFKMNKRIFDINKKRFIQDLKNYANVLKMKGTLIRADI